MTANSHETPTLPGGIRQRSLAGINGLTAPPASSLAEQLAAVGRWPLGTAGAA